MSKETYYDRLRFSYDNRPPEIIITLDFGVLRPGTHSLNSVPWYIYRRRRRRRRRNEKNKKLFVFNVTIEGPRAPAVKPGHTFQSLSHNSNSVP